VPILRVRSLIPLRRKSGWEDNIEIDIKQDREDVDWNHLAMDVGFCEHQSEHSGSVNPGSLLTESYYFSNKDGAP
jgi:hypothetical protein